MKHRSEVMKIVVYIAMVDLTLFNKEFSTISCTCEIVPIMKHSSTKKDDTTYGRWLK